ncbi:hypothetical protein F4818DRAFT_291774 [Hypoxylon cercidicola]|nr:hypothetical protein F4818DRAFT_291774 [Hypoxylon cercidicola]
MDTVKEAIQEYLKAEQRITYVDMENAFRAQDLKLHLIALENPSMLPTHTHMDLQGNLDKKYRVHYRWSDKPLRPREADAWPKSAEENMERLKDAGETVDRGLPKCSNCDEIGHISKRCPQDKTEKERVTIMCYNCDQPGHRVRDCEFDRYPSVSLLANQDKVPSRARTSTAARTAGMFISDQTLVFRLTNRAPVYSQDGHMVAECK